METNWEKSVIEKVLLENIKEQRRSRRWKIFFRLVWIILIVTLLYLVFADRNSKIIEGKHVAVINLKGIIGFEGKTYQTLTEGLEYALEDKNTVGVVIRANSPGGSPAYSNMLYNEILRLRKRYPKKPIDVVVEEVCASGCYYIAAAADKIYANPSSILGSIGVIYTGFGVTELMKKVGVDNRLLIAGKNKAMGYPLLPPNKAQEAMQQEMLNQIHQQFITAVKNGRGKRLSNDPDLFSGRYWIGEDALKLGLIDGYATVNSLAREEFKTKDMIDYTPEQDSFERLAKKFGLSLIDAVKQSVAVTGIGQYN